jgi:glutamate synthase domain-containing protein 3
VLAGFDDLLAKGEFVKVMPHDYKRVLAEQADRSEIGQQAAVPA